jgi:hypothetical protein
MDIVYTWQDMKTYHYEMSKQSKGQSKHQRIEQPTFFTSVGHLSYFTLQSWYQQQMDNVASFIGCSVLLMGLWDVQCDSRQRTSQNI